MSSTLRQERGISEINLQKVVREPDIPMKGMKEPRQTQKFPSGNTQDMIQNQNDMLQRTQIAMQNTMTPCSSRVKQQCNNYTIT